MPRRLWGPLVTVWTLCGPYNVYKHHRHVFGCFASAARCGTTFSVGNSMITRWFSRPTPHPEPDLPMAKHSEIHWFWPNFIDFFNVFPSPHGRMAPKRSLERFYASYASSKMFCEPCTMWNHFFSYTLDGFPGRPLIQNEFSQWWIHSKILWF